jgi:hypothetical protein
LTVDPAGRRVTGTVDVHFTATAPTDRLVFRLWGNAPRPGRAGGRVDIDGSSVTVDGRARDGRYEAAGAAPGRPGTAFVVPLDPGLAAGGAADAHLSFTLTLPGPINDRITEIGSNIRLGSAIPVLSWVRGDGWQLSPAVDAFAEAAASEVADWDVRVTVPAGFTVLASGDEPEPNHFMASAIRDFGMTVGRLRTASATAQAGATTVVAGVGEGAGDDPALIARRAAKAVDALASHFGAYPYARLTVGVTPQLTGGIEFPQHVHLGAGVAASHLVHEIAHQWFYGLAGNDQWRDPWLDESLATYAEARVDGTLAALRAKVIPPDGRGRVGESMAYWNDHRPAYFRSVYVQGAQAMAALADRVGGYGVLDCALRRYVHDRAGTVSRPADFLAALAAQLGFDPRLDLAPFGIR